MTEELKAQIKFLMDGYRDGLFTTKQFRAELDRLVSLAAAPSPLQGEAESEKLFHAYAELARAMGYPHEKDSVISPEEYAAALRKKAERYEWLRQYPEDLNKPHVEHDENLCFLLWGDELDAAIDAAMEKEKSNG
jgi:hypothetical protein